MVALPRLSETIYLPLLPRITQQLMTTANLTELSVSVYMFAMLLFTLVWGQFIDHYGRRPGILISLFTFLTGTIICGSAPNITLLFLGRFIQGIGASAGPVLVQAISNDIYPPQERGKIFSTFSMVVSLSPILGPVLGSFFGAKYGWRFIFFAIALSITLYLLHAFFHVKETLPKKVPAHERFFMKRLRAFCKNPLLIGYSIMLGCLIGFNISIAMEGAFYYVSILKLPLSEYGLLMGGICLFLLIGNGVSRRLNNQKINRIAIFNHSTRGIFIAFALLTLLTLMNIVDPNRTHISIWISATLLSISAFFNGIAFPNIFAAANDGVEKGDGTTLSLFTAMNFGIAIGISTLMGVAHDGTLYPLTVLCLFVAALYRFAFVYLVKRNLPKGGHSS